MMPLVHLAIEITIYLKYLSCEWGCVQAEEKEAGRCKKFNQAHDPDSINDICCLELIEWSLINTF
jgi:hypothetical protein